MVENVEKKCLFEKMFILSNDNYQCLGHKRVWVMQDYTN